MKSFGNKESKKQFFLINLLTAQFTCSCVENFLTPGKDITQKLYSLNEHLSDLDDERKRGKRDELWARAHTRSMSMDAVNTGPTGLVRSQAFKNNNRKHSINSEGERVTRNFASYFM